MDTSKIPDLITDEALGVKSHDETQPHKDCQCRSIEDGLKQHYFQNVAAFSSLPKNTPTARSRLVCGHVEVAARQQSSCGFDWTIARRPRRIETVPGWEALGSTCAQGISDLKVRVSRQHLNGIHEWSFA